MCFYVQHYPTEAGDFWMGNELDESVKGNILNAVRRLKRLLGVTSSEVRLCLSHHQIEHAPAQSILSAWQYSQTGESTRLSGCRCVVWLRLKSWTLLARMCIGADKEKVIPNPCW